MAKTNPTATLGQSGSSVSGGSKIGVTKASKRSPSYKSQADFGTPF